MDTRSIIASLPVAGADRTALIEVANAAFEAVIGRIEPNNVELTRSLWNADDYIDNWLFTDLITADKLPMPRDEIAYYIDAFLVHHVIDLAVAADSEAVASPDLNHAKRKRKLRRRRPRSGQAFARLLRAGRSTR